MTKLDVRAFSLALGSFWGVSVLMLGLASMIWRRGNKIVRLSAIVYRGYSATLSGSLIGAVWGFLDGAVSGLLIAWIYNKFVF